jgi:GntR family transcriptional regulator, transcriptional repressor for pyruvate dehydrogenase complex
VFQPLTREPAYTRVASEIERQIVGRELRDGDLLPPESEIASQFGVHRSTVREALRRLETAGLLTRRTGSKRMVVTRPASAAVANDLSRALLLHDVTFHDVWEAMMLVQPELAALAAQRRSDTGVADLKAASRRFAAAPPGDLAGVAEVGEFFVSLAALAGNPVLALAARPLIQLLEPSLAQVIDAVPQARTRIRDAQQALIRAIEEGEAADARRWMERHISDFRRGFELAGIEPRMIVARG